MRLKKISFIVAVIVIFGLFLFYPPVRRYCCSQEYRTIYSPDNNFKIVVYRISVFPSMMPGSSGDAPGYVRLYNKNNDVLEEAYVSRVGNIYDDDASVYWEKNKVHLPVAYWDLPYE